MLLVSSWLREFVEIPVEDRQLAKDLTMAGIAIDSLGSADNGEKVLEADITTNRPDAMNHYGVAREASAIYDRDLKSYQAAPEEGEQPASSFASVEIADPDLCARYSARVILGVKVGPSPEWLVRRLEAAGLRPINNVTDVTNYLLLELGHPLHAFDLDRLAGRKIVVRRARAGETLITLDEVPRELAPHHLVIADAERPVAIAGVMGGHESSIHEGTSNVLLESAWFEPRSIRKTARQFGLHTEASHRFERGADPAIPGLAADRAAELISAVAGGEILRGLLDVFPGRQPRSPITLRRRQLDRILGEAVPPEQVERILRRLGFQVAPAGGTEEWTALPPSFRLDVERETDLVEEVARHFGYQRFPSRLPAWTGVASRAPHWDAECAVRETALALGYSETISFSLIAPREAQQFSREQPVRLANPLSEEASVLRTSSVPGALSAVEWNLNRGQRRIRLFEIGKIYRGGDGGYQEPPVLCLAASGQAAEASVQAPGRELGFYDLKGDVETLLERFEHRRLSFDSGVGVDYYHPGRAAEAVMDGEAVARFGEIHPQIAVARKWRQPVLMAELFLDRLWQRPLRRPRYETLPRVPAVDRDFSLLLPEGVAFEQVAQAVRSLAIPELAEIRPVEIFRGEAVPEGKYSLLVRLVFQRTEQTLSDAEVNHWSRAIATALEKNLGATLRAEQLRT